MTPTAKLLKAKKIQFSMHEYEHDRNAKSFGLEAADKLTKITNDAKRFF